MSQTATSTHKHDPIAFVAELVELLQSTIHGETGWGKKISQLMFRFDINCERKTYRKAKEQPPLA